MIYAHYYLCIYDLLMRIGTRKSAYSAMVMRSLQLIRVRIKL